MKRARVADAPPRDSIVRLNIGGQIFHTSRETLYGSVFFRSLLEHDFDGDKDKDNNIFVDRSSKLFEELLESLRTQRRPHQRVIGLWKHQLLEECKFFGADEVAARIMGRTVEADLSPHCRIIAAEERDRRGHLIDVFETPLKRKDVEELQLPPLLLAGARARAPQDRVLAGNKSHCHDALNTHMGGMLCALERDPVVCSCVVVAGSSVVAALTGASAGFFFDAVVSAVVNAVALAQVPRVILCPPNSHRHLVSSGDVDLFLIAPTPGEEESVLSRIYGIAKASCKEALGDSARMLVTRSKAAVTLFTQKGAPIQIILNTYGSTDELLTGFDIDCACCGFVLGTGQFVCSARGQRALEYRVNLIQSRHHSAAYTGRLEKYAHRSRGFAVALPGLDDSLLSQDLCSSCYVFIKKRNLLLKVLSCDGPGLSLVTMPARTKVRDIRCRKQKAVRVSEVQRLVVFTFAKNIKEVDTPYVAMSKQNNDVLEAYNMDCPLILHSEERPHDEYWLLWGVIPEDLDDDSDDDSADLEEDDNYTVTPQAKAVMLFDACLKWQSERLGRDTDPRDGGFVFKAQKLMKSSPLCAKSLAESEVHTQLAQRQKLSFVYDYVDGQRSFESLNYVRNAAQSPLRESSNITETQFRELYGLPKALAFTPAARREIQEHDYWGDLYGP